MEEEVGGKEVGYVKRIFVFPPRALRHQVSWRRQCANNSRNGSFHQRVLSKDRRRTAVPSFWTVSMGDGSCWVGVCCWMPGLEW